MQRSFEMIKLVSSNRSAYGPSQKSIGMRDET